MPPQQDGPACASCPAAPPRLHDWSPQHVSWPIVQREPSLGFRGRAVFEVGSRRTTRAGGAACRAQTALGARHRAIENVL